MSRLVPQLKALASERRSRIMLELAEGPLTNTQLIQRTGISKSKVSDNLSILRDVGLITTTVNGRRRFHRINPSELDRVRAFLRTLLKETPHESR